MKLQSPIAQLSLEGEEWNEHFRGELLVYENIEPSETYYIEVRCIYGN